MLGLKTDVLISHDIPLVLKRPIIKTYKALRVTEDFDWSLTPLRFVCTAKYQIIDRRSLT